MLNHQFSTLHKFPLTLVNSVQCKLAEIHAGKQGATGTLTHWGSQHWARRVLSTAPPPASQAPRTWAPHMPLVLLLPNKESELNTDGLIASKKVIQTIFVHAGA
ncbi:unnamed protein product [Arctogadus glacialis]